MIGLSNSVLARIVPIGGLISKRNVEAVSRSVNASTDVLNGLLPLRHYSTSILAQSIFRQKSVLCNQTKSPFVFSVEYRPMSSSKSSLDITNETQIRLAKLISTCGVNMQMSRKSAELLIKAGQVTVFGTEITNPNHLITIESALGGVKVAGKLLQLNVKQEKVNAQSELNELSGDETSNVTNESFQPQRTRVWIANKLPGELVSEHDPQGRPSLLDRLSRGGVGRSRSNKSQKIHLKPIGRLDMMTEGLILVTNDGSYAHEMEHPKNKLHRTYRVRVHGFITPQKLFSLRKGINIDGMFYKGMKVNIETVRDNKGRSKVSKQYQQRAKGGNTNTWLRITCVEGKNRQIRKTLEHVGLKVTRLIRVSFGDYDLNTIPSGMAIEVPFKSLEGQSKKGELFTGIQKDQRKPDDNLPHNQTGKHENKSIQWVRH